MTEVVAFQDLNNIFEKQSQPQTTEVISKNGNFNRIYGRNEKYDGEYKLSQKLLAEFLGTAIFIYGVCSCNVFFTTDYVKTILGSSFISGTVIYIFGRISGAHFNPAVSLALFIRKKLPALEFLLYVISQILGAFLGCVLVALCRRGIFEDMDAIRIKDKKKVGWSYIIPVIYEYGGTFTLVMYVLASCERNNYLGPALGLGYSSVYIAFNSFGAKLSVCSLNPVRALVPAIIQAMAGGNKDPIKQIWLYFVTPFIGAIAAAYTWPTFIYKS